MPDIEHPMVTQIERTGYPNMINQPEHFGIDVMGDEILVGDNYIVLPNEEHLLECNLEDYLIENLGWVYKTAE